MSLGFNAVYLIYFKGDVETIQRYEPLIIAMAFLAPAPFALYPILTSPTLVGDVDTWCWIGKKNATYQVSLWFGELWGVFIINVIVLVMTVVGVKNSKRELRSGGNSSSQHQSKDEKPKEKKEKDRLRSFGSFVILRMIAYLIAFVVVWTPSSVNRITSMVTGSTVYELAILQALVSPQRGLINAVAYWYTWYNSPAVTRERKMSRDLGLGGSKGSRELLNAEGTGMSRSASGQCLPNSASSQSLKYASNNTLGNQRRGSEDMVNKQRKKSVEELDLDEFLAEDSPKKRKPSRTYNIVNSKSADNGEFELPSKAPGGSAIAEESDKHD
ncbi:hypothetical protein HDU91_002606 [Kappamyces sp. JEL0680]|nr:hypothetical protein HDU91_002606 [Kappamyces sp. JEL0680]